MVISAAPETYIIAARNALTDNQRFALDYAILTEIGFVMEDIVVIDAKKSVMLSM